MPRSIYLIGSLRNPDVPALGARLRGLGHTVFDDWHAAGPEADDYWQRYEANRGRSFEDALRAPQARAVFNLDKQHLERADTAVLVMPAGKSAHLELGYFIGRRLAQGLPNQGFIYLPSPPERFDAMYGFAERVCIGEAELLEALK